VRLILILLVALPVLEIWVLIKVGGMIGGLPTIALVILTAAVGVALLRRQGVKTLLRVRDKLERGEVPAGELVEGVFLAVGGLFLLLPGFITDGVGFCCLIPGLRRGLIEWGLRQSLVRKHSAPTNSSTDSHTIEGEYHREDEPRK
jgi:UPF0716 protein FxsA